MVLGHYPNENGALSWISIVLRSRMSRSQVSGLGSRVSGHLRTGVAGHGGFGLKLREHQLVLNTGARRQGHGQTGRMWPDW